MTKEWPQPGDVGMVECSDGEWRRAICGTRMLDDSPVWVFRDGARRDARTSEARPLVVIDPEDYKQTEEHWRLAGQSLSSYRRQLPEFAKPSPPKPEEPKRLGAVVKDVQGRLWVNLADPLCEVHHKPWMCVHDAEEWANYEAIDVAEVVPS